MTGVKRIRTENDAKQDDQERLIAPNDYSFNFTPNLKPSQKLFDIGMTNTDSKPINYSVSTLTHRFRKRTEKLKLTSPKSQLQKQQQQQQEQYIVTNEPYEPMYLRHQDISYTIITYLQMSFNIIITVTVLYIFTKMILVVKHDFKLKAQEHIDLVYQEKLVCEKNYIVNHCGQEDRVPAIETMCEKWMSCMEKDVVVAQAKVSAEAIAEIINSFVEPISYKTLAFLTLLILGSLLFSNFAFSMFKRKYNNRPPLALGHH